MTTEQNAGFTPAQNSPQPQDVAVPASPAPASPTTLPNIPGASMGPFGDLFKNAWNLYSARFKELISMSLIPLGAFIVAGLAVGLLVFLGIISGQLHSGAAFGVRAVLVIAGIAAAALFIVVAIICQAGVMIIIRDSADNLGVKEAFLRAKKIAASYFIVGLLVGIFTILWSLLFIIPGIYMAIAYSQSQWGLLCEGVSGTAALKRSKELVKGYWWPVFARLALVYVLFYIGLAVLGAIFGSSRHQITWGVITQILSLMAAPYFMSYSYFVYQDLRRVKGV